MREYVEEKCKTLTVEQRKQLAVMMNDIVFLLPEDVSVVFDEEGMLLAGSLDSLVGTHGILQRTWPTSDPQLYVLFVVPIQAGSSASW